MIDPTGISDCVPVIIASSLRRWHVSCKEIGLEAFGIVGRQEGGGTLLAKFHQHAREIRAGHVRQVTQNKTERIAPDEDGFYLEKSGGEESPLFLDPRVSLLVGSRTNEAHAFGASTSKTSMKIWVSDIVLP
jgi:hypothetical protein